MVVSVLQYECSARNSIKAYIRSSEICSAQTQALIKFINYIVIIYTMNGMKTELKLVIADSLHEDINFRWCFWTIFWNFDYAYTDLCTFIKCVGMI